MKTIRTIVIIAWFEMLILFRSWFFRIFGILILLFLLGMNIGILSDGGGNWAIKAIPANIPYYNTLILSLAQAFIAMFLALDFLKRDKKLDTSEVIYTRSMTNWAYVWGKSLGIFTVFSVLNILVLVLTLIINLIMTDLPVDFLAYLYYPVLISVPSLVFILGLSFLVMSLVRNQAISLVVLLGYTGLVMFFGKDRYDYIFDFIGYRLPLVHSDLIGFGFEGKLILQRLIYLLFGISFINASILLLKRLPQSRVLTASAWFIMITMAAGGLAALLIHTGDTRGEIRYRKELISLNDQNNNIALLSPENTALAVRHHGKSIEVEARLSLANHENQPISKTVFSLNPGLKLEKLSINGTSGSFERKEHLILITLPSPLQPGERAEVVFSYAGRIDERVCNLDIKKEQAEEKYGPDFLIAIRKRFAMIEPGYVLLTPESAWYPLPGVLHGSNLSVMPSWNFSRYTISVETRDDLQPIVQGPGEKSGNQWSFTPENQLPGVTLIIGPYEKKTLQTSRTDIELNLIKGHDTFSSVMDSITDTLPKYAGDMMQDLERSLGLKYSYPRLRLVEVPVQFYSYSRLWIKNRDFLQPEMILVPERGSMLRRAGFAQEYRQSEKRSKANDESLSEKDLQLRVFRNFLSENFIPGSNDMRFRFDQSSRSITSTTEKQYSLFPQFYTFVNHLESDIYPILNTALEAYVTNTGDMMTGFGAMTTSGLNDSEQANVELQKKSFEQLLKSDIDNEALRKVIDAKGKYFFTYLEAVAGSTDFMPFLLAEMEKYRYRQLHLDSLSADFRERFGFNIDSLADAWFTVRSLPGFLIGNVRVIEVQQDDRTRYQMLYNVSNPSDESGLMQITLRSGGRGMMGGGRSGGMGGGMGRGGSSFALAGRNSGTDKFLIVPGKTAFQVAYILDDQPRNMSVNTLISANLPSTISYPFPTLEQIRGFEPFEGLKPIELFYTVSTPGDIIVDNEDPGFSVLGQATESRLVRWLKINKKDESLPYKGMTFWRPPQFWTPIIQSGFYGELIRSAVYVKSGDGGLTAEWRTLITKPGYYDIYAYINPMTARMGMRMGGGPGGPGGGQGGSPQEISDEYHFTVFHDEGTDDVTLALKSAETGWNHLGSFYYSADTAKVVMTDKNTGKTVVADAVKWVKQQ
ncbi:MAG: hypothetical protein V2A67_04140 [Bacteroidota bacterium]